MTPEIYLAILRELYLTALDNAEYRLHRGRRR